MADERILGGYPRTTSQLALVDWPSGRQHSYAWLDAHVELLARALAPFGERAAIGLQAACSAEAVAGMLAIWRSRCVYLPLDAEAPPSRLGYILSDAAPRALLVDRQAAERLIRDGPPLTLALVALESGAVVPAAAALDAARPTYPASCAYLIYTSGSTAAPKAVLGSREGLLARCRHGWTSEPFADGEVCAQKTARTFIDALWETLGPLGAGVPLLLLPPSLARSPSSLVAALRVWRVSRLLLCPSALRMVADCCEDEPPSRGAREPDGASALPHLRLLSVSGEPLSAPLLLFFHLLKSFYFLKKLLVQCTASYTFQ